MNNIFPNISLIVPVYNAEKSLGKCVEGILSSEYEDFELIFVNDGNNDDSGLNGQNQFQQFRKSLALIGRGDCMDDFV